MDIPSLEPFNPVLDIAQSFQFQHGKFVEEISEVESFFGLDAINMLFKPVDVKGSKRGGVVACGGIVPGMRPEVYRPTVTMVAQFIADCSSSKWSKHTTNSPFLALRATAGSNAAYNIISACSNAVS